MRNLKVGEEVVALNTNPNEIGVQLRIKGKTYTILDTKFCRKCGVQVVHIGTGMYGINDPNQVGAAICICGHREKDRDDKSGWSTAKNFAPIDNLHNALEEAVEEEDYELAVILRDAMKEKAELV